jgi:hypothetical protein
LPSRLNPFKRIILATRIVAFSAVAVATTLIIRAVVSQFISEGGVIPPSRLAWLIAILAMAIVGCILSWRRLRIAGILLIVSGAAMSVDAAIVAGRNQLILLILGLPFIVTGLLFTRLWRRVKPQPKSSDK